MAKSTATMKTKRIFERNGLMVIEKAQNKEHPIFCPDCHEKLSKVFISHDGVPILSGWGICGCRFPKQN